MSLVTIKFFASMKEALGQSTVRIDAEFEPRTVGGLTEYLRLNLQGFSQAIDETGFYRVAINQQMVEDDADVPVGAEVAFFPPVTGG